MWPEIEQSLLIDFEYVGLLIGREGHVIRKIQEETNTIITSPGQDKNGEFFIRGSFCIYS